MLSSTETSACGAAGRRGIAPVQNDPCDDVLVRFEVVAIGDDVLARERAAAAHVAEVFEVHVAAAHRRHPSAQNGHQTGGRGAGILALAQQRLARPRLIALDVDDEHVGAAAAHADVELRDQVALQRADAEDEETAQPDREQDDPRLIAGTAQADHRVAQRKPRRRRERHDDRTSTKAATYSTARHRRKPDADGRPARQEPACHEATPIERRHRQRPQPRLQPVDAAQPARKPARAGAVAAGRPSPRLRRG